MIHQNIQIPMYVNFLDLLCTKTSYMLIVVVIYRYNFAEQQVTKKFSDVEQFSYS